MPRVRPGSLRKPLGPLLWAAAAVLIAALALPFLVERFFLPPLLAGTDLAGQQVGLPVRDQRLHPAYKREPWRFSVD
ncbi:MAG: hypothetical protein PHX57_06620, partial [Desulfobulbaceae bacterium]|nr:hypothetical protein [Desulfobulbaceae bacterium]